MEDGKYFASIIGDSMTTCDEIIDAVAKSYNEETKTVTTNFNKKKSNLESKKFLCFTFLFVNYHSIIDTC